jgi:hypothetical protein
MSRKFGIAIVLKIHRRLRATKDHLIILKLNSNYSST